jgi:hypothetical protein
VAFPKYVHIVMTEPPKAIKLKDVVTPKVTLGTLMGGSPLMASSKQQQQPLGKHPLYEYTRAAATAVNLGRQNMQGRLVAARITRIARAFLSLLKAVQLRSS